MSEDMTYEQSEKPNTFNNEEILRYADFWSTLQVGGGHYYDTKIDSQDAAGALTDFVNHTPSDDNHFFIEAMSRHHRTLQQKFTRLCLDWIYFMAQRYEHKADRSMWFDARNEGAGKACSAILEALENTDDSTGKDYPDSVYREHFALAYI